MDIDVCIVGFGFTQIPLILELERTNTNFCIISTGGSVWAGLEKVDRLDFDLVSSLLSSYYSFELVDMFEQDYFPTAKEFRDLHLKWYERYKDKIIDDFVVRIDNFADHSRVSTRSGKVYRANHLVLATAFKRSIHGELGSIDYSMRNRTVVFDTMGDSVNLIISRLLANGNKIILRTNGFYALDKWFQFGDNYFSLDQLEFHNMRYACRSLYARTVLGGNPHLLKANDVFLHSHFPNTLRPYEVAEGREDTRPHHGHVAIKYWPVDSYKAKYGDDVAGAIRKGYLLNDVALWLWTGRVIAVPKDTPIDFDKRTITYAGVERVFDEYIVGDTERPNLPPIHINGGDETYEYDFKDAFMGVLPSKLSNVYLLGFTRPLTGGLNNITEMQGIFIHKLITQEAFHKRITGNLKERIKAYYSYHHTIGVTSRSHVLHYGFYTDEIARLMGIEVDLEECSTLREYCYYYAFPNDAFKYRRTGEYKIDGVEDLVAKVNERHSHFAGGFLHFARQLAAEGEEGRQALSRDLPPRMLFNDIRHKDPYAAFVEEYFRTYRRIHGLPEEPLPEDEGWKRMVAEASRDKKEAPPIAGEELRAKNRNYTRYFLDKLDTPVSSRDFDPVLRKTLDLLMARPDYALPHIDG
jgi:hypothetical protein